MILVALGANLEHPRFGPPRRTCEAALACFPRRGISLRARSKWYRSAPVPVSDQPWFVNGVAVLETDLSPVDLLVALHDAEEKFGRVRLARNEARVLDLDLLAYDERVSAPGESPILPHPRLGERAFVLLPLSEVAPAWRHPVNGLSAAEMAAALGPHPAVEPLE